jgi:hypothetical protein
MDVRGTAGADLSAKDIRLNGAQPPEQAINNAAPAKARGRKPQETEEPASHARFFLAKRDNAGPSPVLDRECTTEGEALVEALKGGGTYYRIEEYKPVADFSGKAPALLKEAVSRR